MDTLPEWTGPGDGECTWWPDVWGRLVLTACCRAHDAAGLNAASDAALRDCVAALAADYWWGPFLALAMWVGVRVCGPIRQWWLARGTRR